LNVTNWSAMFMLGLFKSYQNSCFFHVDSKYCLSKLKAINDTGVVQRA
jgi:hypothetical protein